MTRERQTQLATELTEIGEQYVIPGCERDKSRGPAQMNLWGSAPPQSRTNDDVQKRDRT